MSKTFMGLAELLDTPDIKYASRDYQAGVEVGYKAALEAAQKEIEKLKAEIDRLKFNR